MPKFRAESQTTPQNPQSLPDQYCVQRRLRPGWANAARPRYAWRVARDAAIVAVARAEGRLG